MWIKGETLVSNVSWHSLIQEIRKDIPLFLYTYFNSCSVFVSVLVLFFCNAVLPFSRSAMSRDADRISLRDLAEAVAVLCGKYSSTLRQVLKYFPQSTISLSAWSLSVYGSEAHGQAEVFRLLALFSHGLSGT